jgi:hypothetical protein
MTQLRHPNSYTAFPPTKAGHNYNYNLLYSDYV